MKARKVNVIASRLFSFVLLLSAPVMANVTLSFDKHTVSADIELTQPIVTANVLPQAGKELIALGVDDKQQRWMIIYGLIDDTLQPLDRLLLNKEVFRFDVHQPQTSSKVEVNNDVIQPLYFLSADTLYVYQAALSTNSPAATSAEESFSNQIGSSSLKALLPISSITITDKPDYISRGKFAKDINHDGYSDVVLSDFTEVHVLLGSDSGEYRQQSIPLRPNVELTRSGAEYSRAEIFASDINNDHRDDIIKVAEGMLEVYLQLESGDFAPYPTFVPVSQPISGVNWWNKRDAYGRPLDQSDLLYRKVEQIKDINADGITDLVVRYTKSSGVFDRSNDYEIYLGSIDSTVGQVRFGREPSSVIRADGTLTGLRFSDLDSDEKDEVIVSGFDIGVSQIIGALLSGSIDQDVYVFKMDDNNQFPTKANATKQVELSFSLTSGQSGEPVVAMGDLNGDGYHELILSDSDDKLKIFAGQSGNKPFSNSSVTVRFPIPTEGSMLSVVDINNDGKDDILVQYGRQDADEYKRLLRVFVTQ